jgi:hypothetical protein
MTLLLVSAVSLTAAAAPRFPNYTEVDDVYFYKMGEHRSIYKLFFKLYDAALFAEPSATSTEVLTRNCAFQLEFRYLRNIPKATILESAEHMLNKNLSAEQMARIRVSMQQLHASYRSVIAGDRSSLTYIPNKGTTFTLNGSQLITIPGKEFAQCYLDIWLGAQPISVELRDQLLAQ